jgi:hypothetical protein
MSQTLRQLTRTAGRWTIKGANLIKGANGVVIRGSGPLDRVESRVSIIRSLEVGRFPSQFP